MKKAALKKSSSNEILFFYTFIGFLFTLPYAKEALALSPLYILKTVFLPYFLLVSSVMQSIKSIKALMSWSILASTRINKNMAMKIGKPTLLIMLISSSVLPPPRTCIYLFFSVFAQ